MTLTVKSTPTDRNQQENRLSVNVEKRDFLKKRYYLHPHNPFNYSICISWFGGIQIHPKF